MLIETLIAIVIALIAIIFLNPGHLTMPESVVSMLTVGIIVAFFIFAGFVFREKTMDEREAAHLLRAGRFAYLSGMGVLVVAIIVQATQHEIDIWLVLSLCVMLLAKISSRIYSRIKM